MQLLRTSTGPKLPQPGHFIGISTFVLPDERVAGAAEEFIDDFVAGFMVSRFSKGVVGYRSCSRSGIELEMSVG